MLQSINTFFNKYLSPAEQHDAGVALVEKNHLACAALMFELCKARYCNSCGLADLGKRRRWAQPAVWFTRWRRQASCNGEVRQFTPRSSALQLESG
jgi:hypothetical protein